MIYSEVKIGLIGLGTVGKGLANAISNGEVGRASLKAVLVKVSGLEAARNVLQKNGLDTHLTTDPAAFFNADTNLVVEAAGQMVVRTYGAQTLASGRDLLICATGAFTDEGLYQQFALLAEQYGRRIIIPSGAIAGLDAISAAAIAGLDEVTIVTRKPPSAWKGTPAEKLVDLDSVIEHPHCLFEGTAREAARLFPQNVNVAATLACAGIGLDRTRARVYADPTIRQNVHQINVQGKCGELSIDVRGLPSPDNPRTSVLTAYSVIRALRNLTSPVVVW